MPYFHFAAASRWPLTPFNQREACVEMWSRLRARFERVLACVLMPDHLHLLVDADSPETLRTAMRIEMAAFTRRISPGKPLWQPAAAPELIPDFHHLKRQIRYVHLNPCRAGLAMDPLEWEWSTHRDAVGAAFPAWLDMPLLTKGWKSKSKEFASAFHAYVSGDPTVRVDGTPLPRTIALSKMATTLESIEWAVEQATRSPSNCRLRNSDARRIMFLLADRIGPMRRQRLASWAGITERRARGILGAPPTPSEEAALASAILLLSARHRFERVEFPKTGNYPAVA